MLADIDHEERLMHRSRPLVILASAALGCLCLLGASPLSSSEPVQAQSGGSVPSNASASTGPLIGDPSLISNELACVSAEQNAPWFPTIAAFEVHDSHRTHLYACAHFDGAQSSGNQVFTYSSQQTYVTPYNLVDHGSNELFIYGGGYGDNPAASGSFVARIEPGTLNEVWRHVLINTNVTDEWNYPGVLNVDRDGNLVVIYGYHIAKLDPTTGNVLAQTTLPTGTSAPRDTSFNGYDALTDGTIVAKSVNRQPGCEQQGFSAFLSCPNPTTVPPSVMVAIDPATLKVMSQVILPEMIGGRVTTTIYNGANEIYLPGATNLFRYTYADGQFIPDARWGPVPYLTGSQTAASAMAVIGEYVVTMTNGGAPSATPMSVIAIPQADSSKVSNIQPFGSGVGQQSFIPSMVSVDPENNRIYVMDAGVGKLAGVDLQNGNLTVAWTQDQTTLSFTTLVGPNDQRILIGTDIPATNFQGLSTYTTE